MIETRFEPAPALPPFYPFIGEDDHGLVVLFLTDKTGTVLATPNGSFCVGQHLNCWAMHAFKRMDRSLVMRNA